MYQYLVSMNFKNVLRRNNVVFAGIISILQIDYCGASAVQACPTSRNAWEQRSKMRRCSEGKYHCMLDSNEELVEVCTRPRFISERKYCITSIIFILVITLNRY